MLLTIHNLPLRIDYAEIKELIITKCGLRDSIVDNLVNEGAGMRVTVGVMEEEDAAILVRKINGLYYKGQQLYVQDKRVKRESEQPYRAPMQPRGPNQTYGQNQPPGPSQTYAQNKPYSQNQPRSQMPSYEQQPEIQMPTYGQNQPHGQMQSYGRNQSQSQMQSYGQNKNQPQGKNEPRGQMPYGQQLQGQTQSYGQNQPNAKNQPHGQLQSFGQNQSLGQRQDSSQEQYSMMAAQAQQYSAQMQAMAMQPSMANWYMGTDQQSVQNAYMAYENQQQQMMAQYGMHGQQPYQNVPQDTDIPNAQMEEDKIAQQDQGWGDRNAKRDRQRSPVNMQGSKRSKWHSADRSQQGFGRPGRDDYREDGRDRSFERRRDTRQGSGDRSVRSTERRGRSPERPDRKRRWDEPEREPPKDPQSISRQKIRNLGFNRILADTIETLRLGSESGPSSTLGPIKKALRQLLNLRITEIAGDTFMSPDIMFNTYRRKYPSASDFTMYIGLKEIVSGEREEDWNKHLMHFVESSNRGEQQRMGNQDSLDEDNRGSRFDDKPSTRFDDNRGPRFNDNRGPRFDDNRDSRFDDNRDSRFDNNRGSRFDDSRSSRSDEKRSSRFNDERSSRFDDERSSRFDDERSSRFDDNRSSRFDDNRSSRFDDNRSSRFDDNPNQSYGSSQGSRFEDDPPCSKKPRFDCNQASKDPPYIPLRSKPGLPPYSRSQEIRANCTAGMMSIFSQMIKTLNIVPEMQGPSPVKSTVRKILAQRVAEIVGDNLINSHVIITKYRAIYPRKDDFVLYKSVKQMVAERLLQGEELKNFISSFVIPVQGATKNNREGPERGPLSSQTRPNQPPNPNMRPPNPNIRSPNPNMRPSNPNIRPPNPNMRPPNPNIRPPNPNMRPANPNMRPPNPNMRPPNPSNGPPRASFVPWNPKFRPPNPNNGSPKSNMQPKGPNFNQPNSQNPPLGQERLPAHLYPDSPGPGKQNPGQKPVKVLNEAQMMKREFRGCTIRAAEKIMTDLAEHLNIEPLLNTQKLLNNVIRKAIMLRVTNLLDDEARPLDEVCSKYYEVYPSSQDLAFYKKIKHRVTTMCKPNQIKVDVFTRDWLNTLVVNPKPKKIPEPVPKAPKKNNNNKMPKDEEKPLAPPAQLAPGTAETAPAPAQPAPAAGPSTGVIPSYPQGNKKIHTQLKRQTKLEQQTLPTYDMSPAMDKALIAEITLIGNIISNEFKAAGTAADRRVIGHVNMKDCVEHCQRFLAHHISKRVTDSGLKMCRIYGHPRPPKRKQLMAFLNNYKCLSVKKSVRAKFLTASFESYEAIDKLCSMPPINIDGNNVSFKPMNVAPPKAKFNSKNEKSLRKKFVKSLVENSKVNLLDKDWQLQEEEEKKAKADFNEASDDVIFVEEEDNTIDITQDEEPAIVGVEEKPQNKEENIDQENNENVQDTPGENTEKNDSIEKATEDTTNEAKDTADAEDPIFLHEDFKVIDEVRESDNDDNDTSKRQNSEEKDDQRDGVQEQVKENQEETNEGQELENENQEKHNEVNEQKNEDFEQNNENEVDDNWDQNGEDWDDIGNTETNNDDPNSSTEIANVIDEIGDILDDEENDKIGESAANINIIDVDFDEDDLEDY